MVVGWASIDKCPTGQKNEVIKLGIDRSTWLMNGTDNSVTFLCKFS
jgi:hypothetical protein